MSRIPASASVVLAGLLPVCAAALGLGEVETKSYLNQPLAAEIPILSDTPGEAVGLNVTLASADTFAEYGLHRPGFLSDIAFNVVAGPGGPVIRMTTAQPVPEPFVTVLLEVRWPQGRLLREYTVLLDPPAFTGGAVRQPVQAPTAPAAAPPVARVPVASAEAPAAAVGTGGDGTHTVARNETLWRIADRYRPDPDTDINQMMLAIYRTNPDAFAGNINRLNAGAVLRIPDRAAVEGMSRGEAVAEVRRQNREWRGSAATQAARLELVPPAEAAQRAAAAPAASSRLEQLQSEVEESRRLVAVKDAELQALRNRLAQLEKQGAGDVAIEAEPTPGPAPVAQEPAVAPVAEPAGEAPAAVAEKPAPARRVRAAPSAAEDAGIVATIISLVRSPWLWIVAVVVMVAALLMARRRAAAGESPVWQPTTRRGGPEVEAEADELAAGRGGDEHMIVIEEPGRAQATGGFERRAVARGDEETPLERTISTESPVNLDQSDPLAEADFHMAYGLYDQAADLLTAAIAREPARRDLQLKLLDVYFVWENRDGFLKEAQKLHERIGNEADPDWKRVIIMGKQLCPTEALFAGAAAPAAAEMDLAFGTDGGTVDLPFAGQAAALDFDLSGGDGADIEPDASTRQAPPRFSGQTQELPTIEAPGMDFSTTMETPTIESATLSSTLETPTLETPMGDRTIESPTMETWSPDAGSTAKLQGVGGEERADTTAEIDLEDLGLDLTGLDEAARDMATGLQEALPEAGGNLDFDLSGETIASADGDESTAEMENSPTLGNLTRAMGKGSGAVEDTAEQPGVGDVGATRSGRALSATSDELESLNIDLGIGGPETSPTDLTATGLRAIGSRRPEDPTMTEVGTKLDLARAYVDMGDPDGARSILNEVLEEGDAAQRQEARQLLDELNG